MKLNVKTLGQVFTPNFVVGDMINLIKNKGSILEPSSGDGSFTLKLSNKNIKSIEIDPSFKNLYKYENIDFFEFSIKNTFDTIIGNPPYVRFQDIKDSTKELFRTNLFNNCEIDYSLFDRRSNLYLFFIYKSILHLNPKGELIFITPRDFLKSTSSINLNNFIYDQGSITDIIELGDRKIFKNAQPNTIIWRFEKGNFCRKTSVKKNFILNKGQLLFTKNTYPICFKEIAFVKVGAVSGSDKCFEHKEGIEFVCSYTNKSGKTKKMIYNSYHPSLEKYKSILIKRRIKKFSDQNWFEWGRKYFESKEKRIYVNNKTRNKNPFFISKHLAYDGSILAIFPNKKLTKDQLVCLCQDLNSVNWLELGFVVDGRFIFNQKSLENTILPINFKKYLKK